MEDIKKEILRISRELNLSHIGSNISCVPILFDIYTQKKTGDIVILDNAHAHVAHLAVKVYFGEFDFVHDDSPDEVIKKYGIHCDRKAGCDSSGGSLGHNLGIGIGYALAYPDRSVYVILSEGSLMEGSTWEALRIYSNSWNLHNLHIHCNFNGFTATSTIDIEQLEERMKTFSNFITFHYTDNGEGFEGVQGNYKKL